MFLTKFARFLFVLVPIFCQTRHIFTDSTQSNGCIYTPFYRKLRRPQTMMQASDFVCHLRCSLICPAPCIPLWSSMPLFERIKAACLGMGPLSFFKSLDAWGIHAAASMSGVIIHRKTAMGPHQFRYSRHDFLDETPACMRWSLQRES